MTKKQQSILIEANAEPLEVFVPLDENDELCEFFRIYSTIELDLL
jgi:hypothetical protein